MNILIECLIALIAIIAIPFYYYYTRLYRIEKFFENFPTPPTKPIVGNARNFTSPGEFLTKLHQYAKEYGTLFHLKVGPVQHVLVCSDYKFLEFLLSSNTLLKKSKNLKFLEPWIGAGLISADGGPQWKIHRRLLTPTFHFKILEQFVDIFESSGDILVKKLAEVSGNKSVDVYPYVTRCTLDLICETAMGTKINAQSTEKSAYFESVRHMCRIFIVRTMSILSRYDLMFSFTKDYAIQKKSLEILHSYTDGIIKSKRKNLNDKVEKENLTNEVEDLGIKKKKAFLDLILEARVDGQALSDEEIRDEVATFTFAGHDTTATATSFILYCIANNKEVQQKILEEQEQFFGEDRNPKVTYADLQKMKYLENVIKEGLRLYSPVPFYGRQISHEVEYDGMIIPKGVGVIIFSHGIHMNPKYYPNPEKFDPSRFENIDGTLPYAYIPFSAGPRNCIGQKYAMFEIKSVVSKIVRNFDLSPASPRHEMNLSPETVLKSLNGVQIGLKLRS